MKELMIAALLAYAGLAVAAPEWVRGVVVKIEPEKARVTLKHERIRAIGMEAMTMPFPVTDKAILTPFKRGEKVRFTITTANDHLAIDAMERAR
jgi:Cu/Ag efflux protein CusF